MGNEYQKKQPIHVVEGKGGVVITRSGYNLEKLTIEFQSGTPGQPGQPGQTGVSLLPYEQAPKTWAGGTDLYWILDRVPVNGTILLFADRMRLVPGIDYTLSESLITIINGPLNAGVITTCVFFYQP